MMLEELGLVVDDSNPLINGVVTFISFAVFGFLPLVPYVIGYGIQKDDKTQYMLISLIIGGVELFSLGFAKAVLIGLNKFKAGTETLLLGSLAVAMGYLMGMAFNVSEWWVSNCLNRYNIAFGFIFLFLMLFVVHNIFVSYE